MMHVALTVQDHLTLLTARVRTLPHAVWSSVINWAKVPALSIVGISIGQLVAFMLLMLGGHAQPYVGNNAEKIYLPAASHILATGSFDDPNTYAYSTEAPGYPVLLAVLQRISTEYYLPLTVSLQMLLNCCIALLLLLLGNRMSSSSAGWLAGVLWLFFPPAVVISTWITAETLFTALLLLGMVLWIHSLSGHGAAAFSFISGLILGVATLVRASIQFLPIFLFLIVLFKGFSKCLPKCALLLLGAFLVIFPWTLRNLYVFGEPIIVQTGFGAV
ncbi:MAG TPA: hypothetical protein VJP04_12160, partial [Terriglobales bacterium]|nr:hypothetical protein [Terriglobales bacterium]